MDRSPRGQGKHHGCLFSCSCKRAEFKGTKTLKRHKVISGSCSRVVCPHCLLIYFTAEEYKSLFFIPKIIKGSFLHSDIPTLLLRFLPISFSGSDVVESNNFQSVFFFYVQHLKPFLNFSCLPHFSRLVPAADLHTSSIIGCKVISTVELSQRS